MQLNSGISSPSYGLWIDRFELSTDYTSALQAFILLEGAYAYDFARNDLAAFTKALKDNDHYNDSVNVNEAIQQYQKALKELEEKYFDDALEKLKQTKSEILSHTTIKPFVTDFVYKGGPIFSVRPSYEKRENPTSKIDEFIVNGKPLQGNAAAAAKAFDKEYYDFTIQASSRIKKFLFSHPLDSSQLDKDPDWLKNHMSSINKETVATKKVKLLIDVFIYQLNVANVKNSTNYDLSIAEFDLIIATIDATKNKVFGEMFALKMLCIYAKLALKKP